MKKLELRKTDTGKFRNGRYHYEVIENGTVLCDRHSDRDYVACYVSGDAQNGFAAPFFFGRIDLVGKGTSKNFMNWNDKYAIATINN